MKRYPIVLNEHAVALLTVFKRTDYVDDLWVTEYISKEIKNNQKQSAKQFVDALEENYSNNFLRALKDEIDILLNKNSLTSQKEVASQKEFNEGDWVIFDLSIGQIKKIDKKFNPPFATFEDGYFNTNGNIYNRFRSLTLQNKRIVESINIYYDRLREIDGSSAFNYPEIFSYFTKQALNIIDDPKNSKLYYDTILNFIEKAKKYEKYIDGIPLFRPK